MAEIKRCSYGCVLKPGYKCERGTITDPEPGQKPNVLYCEDHWEEEPFPEMVKATEQGEVSATSG